MILGTDYLVSICADNFIKLDCTVHESTQLILSVCKFRLLGWWSIDEGSREEQAGLYHDGASGLVYF